MATATVKQIRENIKTYQSVNGTMYVHGITLTTPQSVEGVDVIDFFYHSKSAKCEKFKAGEESTFLVEKKTFGKDGIEYKISPQAPAFVPQKTGGGYGGQKTSGAFGPKDEGRISWLSCFSSVCNLYAGSKFIDNFPEILKKANEAFNEAAKHSDKV